MANLYLYFSGTGNTKYVIEKFSEQMEEGNDYSVVSIEHKDMDYDALILQANIITIAYPIYDSMLPFIVTEFLEEHLESFRHRDIITITTQLLFSGDGGGLPFHILKKVDVNPLHSIHINMPSNLVDVPIFLNKPIEKTTNKVAKADEKIARVVWRIKHGKTIRDGRKLFSWALGYFVQRAYGKGMLKKLRSRVKIDHDTCINCNKCVPACPTDNLFINDRIIDINEQCTLCYRCVNLCPTKAISIFLKKKPKVQYIRDTYN